MNWKTLKTEISLPAYAGMDDAAIASAINARTLTQTRPYYASARTLYGLFGPTKGRAIMDAISTDDPNLHQMMLQVGDTNGTAGGIDVSLTDTQDYVQTLVARGIMTAADMTSLIALATTVTPWRQSALGQADPVSADQIASARSLEVTDGE